MMMFRKSRKAQSLAVEHQKFNNTDAEVLLAASRSPLFTKIGKDLQAELVTKVLSGKVDAGYHAGWIDCMSYLDGLVERAAIAVHSKESEKEFDNGDMDSMQMEA